MASVTITHTRADGTLLAGSVKGDGVYDIVRHHGFRSSRSLGMLYVRNSRDGEAPRWRIDAAAAALREAGHEVTVEIDESERRSFAEAEADRLERAGDRAERYEGYADNAAASSNARHAKADQISKRFEFGQPILVGHHSESRARRDAARIDTNLREAIAEGKRAGYWQGRTRAAENYEAHRYDPNRTRRRLEKLRAELRQQERYHTEAVEKGWDSAGRYARRIEDLTEEIAHWEAHVEKAKAEGVKLWEADDFAPGDFVMYLGSWHEVKRVNSKTLSVAWNLRLAPKLVLTLEDSTDHGRVGTFSADYTQVQGRCPGEAMRAFLAEGKVPGPKKAAEASQAAPADTIRATQAEAKAAKSKRRSDAKTPKRVKVECRWNATEATLTWLNGRGQPHKDHPPVTISAPEGEKFTESVGSRSLRSQVTKVLTERGYAYRGSWSGSPGRGIVCAIEPAQVQLEIQGAGALDVDDLVRTGRDTPAYRTDDECPVCGAETGEPCTLDCSHRGGEATKAARALLAGLLDAEFETVLQAVRKRKAVDDQTPSFFWAWSAVEDEATHRSMTATS